MLYELNKCKLGKEKGTPSVPGMPYILLFHWFLDDRIF